MPGEPSHNDVVAEMAIVSKRLNALNDRVDALTDAGQLSDDVLGRYDDFEDAIRLALSWVNKNRGTDPSACMEVLQKQADAFQPMEDVISNVEQELLDEQQNTMTGSKIDGSNTTDAGAVANEPSHDDVVASREMVLEWFNALSARVDALRGAGQINDDALASYYDFTNELSARVSWVNDNSETDPLVCMDLLQRQADELQLWDDAISKVEQEILDEQQNIAERNPELAEWMAGIDSSEEVTAIPQPDIDRENYDNDALAALRVDLQECEALLGVDGLNPDVRQKYEEQLQFLSAHIDNMQEGMQNVQSSDFAKEFKERVVFIQNQIQQIQEDVKRINAVAQPTQDNAGAHKAKEGVKKAASFGKNAATLFGKGKSSLTKGKDKLKAVIKRTMKRT